MMGTLQQQGYALRQAVRQLLSAPLAHLLTILVIGLSLALPVVLYRVVSDLGALARTQAGPPQLTVFLALNASETVIERARTALQARTDLASVEYIAPAAALAEIQRSTHLDDVLAGLDSNPLPGAFVVRPRDGEPAALAALQKALKLLPGVELVQLDAEWARRVYALGQLTERGILLLAGVLATVVLTVVVNTLRLQVLAARAEVEVCKLLGASNAFVRRPFVYFGILQVLLGALLAMGLAELAVMAVNQACADWLDPLGLVLRLQAPNPVEWAVLLGGALVMGWLAGAFTVTLFLRDWQRH